MVGVMSGDVGRSNRMGVDQTRECLTLKKFSFVIPAYNCKCLLKNTLEALNNQRGCGINDYEVIVVDDGSDDQTQDYVEGVNRNYELKYIYLERENNSSRSRARNMGWKTATGEIIVFIDADIIVKPTHLAELERFYQYEGNLAVLGNRINLPCNTKIDFNSLFEQYGLRKCDKSLLDATYFIFDVLSYNAAAFRIPGLLLATNNAAVPKRYLAAVNGFDENFIGWGLEDIDLGYRLQTETDIQFTFNSQLEVLHQYHHRLATDFDALARNRKYFMCKYPELNSQISGVKELEIWNISELPPSQYQNRFLTANCNKYKRVVLEFHSGDNLRWFEETISRLASIARLDLIIYDQAEDTDLDIRIQLLGRCNSTPRYYPVSKMTKRY